MSIEFDVLKEVVGHLEEAGIPYMITGSIAANFYSVPRMTRDIDVIIELHAQDIEKLYRLFEKGFYIDKDMILDAVKKGGMFNIIHYKSVFKVDFIIRKQDVYRIEEFNRKKRVKIEDVEANITAPEDLILSKLYWAKGSLSELQMNDAKNILKQTPDLDKEYLARWAKYLGIEDLYERIKP